ncbi:rap1 GTPase-GDP dissociation stimulator 1-A isoform 2-T2 [Spinachia spinachia]
MLTPPHTHPWRPRESGFRGDSSGTQTFTPNYNLNNALGTIRVLGLELNTGELKPHLDTVLTNIREKTTCLHLCFCWCPEKGAAEQVVISGILPVLAVSLRSRGPLTVLTAQLVAELAMESVVRKGFGDAGLVPALLSVLTSPDQEVILHAARAISLMSYESSKLQELLLRRGAVPRLVNALLRFPDQEALEEVCLQGLCNLSGMGVAEEAGLVWERGASVRPGESVFHGVSPPTCGFASSVTLVRVSQWAPGQYAVNVEVFQRCSSSFWGLGGNKRPARWSPFPGLGSCSDLYKVLRFSKRNIPGSRSLKTRVFHTFL